MNLILLFSSYFLPFYSWSCDSEGIRMIPGRAAVSATQGLVKTGQFASDAVNVLNTTDSILNRLIPDEEEEMPGKDETTYISKKTVLTHHVMIELLSDNLAKELFRPDQRIEAQSFLQRLLFSCCCPPKPLMQLSICVGAGGFVVLLIEVKKSFLRD